jgi:hypothetical protein
MEKTTDRQVVNGVTYMIMDSAARASVQAEETARIAAINAETSVIGNFLARNIYPFELNTYIDNSSGESVTANGWAKTPLLPIVPNTKCELLFSGNYRLWNLGIYDRKSNKIAVDQEEGANPVFMDDIVKKYPDAKFFAFSIWDGATSTELTEQDVASWVCVFSYAEKKQGYYLNRYYLNDDGEIRKANGWAASRICEIVPNMQYSFSFSGNYIVWNLCIYDQNNTFIGIKTTGMYSFLADDILREFPAAKYIAYSVWDGQTRTPLTNEDVANWEMSITDPYDNRTGKKIAENTWSIGSGRMKIQADLFGSGNGTFTYDSLKCDGSTFKDVTDDITPMKIAEVGYIGANHGYYYVYQATLANHGLTVADIGKSCVINGETWVLLQVPSTSVFVVACKDDTKWYGVKTVDQPPTTFDFGTSIEVTSISGVKQFYPSVKNIHVSVIENTSEAFAVSESYDVINMKTGIARIIENIGSNDNNSVANRADSIMTVRNVYTFAPNCACVLTQNLKMNNPSVILDFYGGTQSMPFGDNDYYAVPLTSSAGFSTSGERNDFSRSEWDDSTIPPIIYIQINKEPASASKMMIQGIIMEDRNSYISSDAGFIYTSRKMYPYAIQPNASSLADYTYNFTSFRIPIISFDIDDTVKFAGYCKVGKDYYFFCCHNSAISKTIAVPSEMVGKKVETIISRNASCINSIVSYGIDVKTTGEGYLLLKLSD